MVSYKSIFQALHRANVRYLVAGGVAVNLHQVIRATMDLDLIVHLERDNVVRFVAVMGELGFIPRVPVKPEDFADEKIRESWIEEKNMVVFSFINPTNPLEVIDVFVREPKPFSDLYEHHQAVKAFEMTIPVLSLEDLIALKKEAGREKDFYDIKLLEKRR